MRIPSVSVVAAPDPPIAAAGDHVLVATGRTRRGMSISTGTAAVAVFVLLPEKEAAFVRMVPSGMVVSCGTRIATWRLRVDPSLSRPSPVDWAGTAMG